MTYEEYKREIATKGYDNVASGRIVSKKTESTVEFFDLEAETGKFMINQEKARKKAVKATNDAEIARRQGLYPKTERYGSEPTKADPNAAFKRKRSRQGRFFTRPALETKDIDNILEELRMKDNPINAPSKKVETKVWNPETEQWEDED